MGVGAREALVLGARLLLRTRDGATDILLLLPLLRLGVKLVEVADDDDRTASESEPESEWATSTWSSHLWTPP